MAGVKPTPAVHKATCCWGTDGEAAGACCAMDDGGVPASNGKSVAGAEQWGGDGEEAFLGAEGGGTQCR